MFTRLKLKRKIFRENKKSTGAQQEMFSQLGITPSPLSELKSFKRSDVLFIFGSGASICNISNQQWSQINRKDSLGINLWLIHPHIPNFYTFEVPRLYHHQEVMMHNLRIRAKDYRHTAFLFKGGNEFNEKFAGTIKEIATSDNLSMFIPTYFTVGDESQFVCLLKNYDLITKKLRLSSPDALFRKRASIVFSTMLGYDLGYKDIVFCGIDGKAGSGYFYEDKEQTPFPGTIVPEDSGQQKGAIHKTMNPSINPLTAERCLQLIDTHLLTERGVRMWVGTTNSILSEWLPSWKWQL